MIIQNVKKINDIYTYNYVCIYDVKKINAKVVLKFWLENKGISNEKILENGFLKTRITFCALFNTINSG